MNFDDAPHGDMSLDDIFGDQSSARTTEPAANTTTVAATTTTQTTEPFIKTKTGTIYKTTEDAVEGIEHKDALIAQLREQVRQTSGKDPLTVTKPVTEQPVNYAQDQDKYFEDIASAVDKKDTKAYMAAQQKLMWDTLGPIAPTLTALSRANAERIVVDQIPDFRGFRNSDQFTTLQQEAPLLADAIRTAEDNPAAAQQLPELYKIAYLASQGRRVPELIQGVRNETQAPTPRPTVQSTQLAPPPTTGVPAVQPGMNSSAERKALIERAESGGVLNLRW